MRYVDLSPTYYKKKKGRKTKYLKLLLVVVVLSFVGYISYLLFWPTTLVVKQILKAPQTALSFFKSEREVLASTNGRTNFLLLGLDRRFNEPRSYQDRAGNTYKNGFRSDTMVVLSVDLVTKNGVMISLPRDLWVKIPSGGKLLDQYAKINAAYSLGNTNDFEGGGLSLAKKVVNNHLGLPIHYSLAVDFEGFRKLVDTLGGIMVNAENSFDDWNYPIEGKENDLCGGDTRYLCRFQHIKFEKGPQFMDGEATLKFVRSRTGTNSEGSDFARARRQQRVLIGIRNKALTWQILSDPLKVAGLIGGFGDSVETDFDLQAYPQVYKLLSQIDLNNVRSTVLDPSAKPEMIYTPPADEYGGAYVLVPRKKDWSEVQNYVRDFLAGLEEKEATSSAN